VKQSNKTQSIMPAPHTTETSMKCLVVIPTYNEAENIRVVLQDLLELETPVDILVVDDGSPDGTGDLVAAHPQFAKRVFLIRRPRKSGFAGACKAGYQWSLQKGYDECGTMDADLSHDPKDVPRLIAALQRGAEIAVGSRYLDGIRIINWPMWRLLLSWFAGVYARAVCGIPMTDPTSGFKMISKKALRSVNFSRCSADGYGFQLELHFFAWRAGCKLEEIPIIFTERKRGASKMSNWTVVEAMLTVLALGLRRLVRRRSGS
jgi:dolichol-phosphate mannosyltransferase